MTQSEPRANSRLRNGVFFLFFAGYLGSALVILGLGLAALIARDSVSLHDRLHTIGLGDNTLARVSLAVADATHQQTSILGLVLDYGFSLFNIGLAIFLIWLRRKDRTAKLLSIGLVGTAAVFNLQAHSVYELMLVRRPEFLAHSAFQFVAGAAYVFALLLFPDGRLVPRWSRLKLTTLYVPVAFAVAFGSSRLRAESQTVALLIFFGLLTPVAGVISQAYRFRRSPGPEERQQSRLLFWALTPALAIGLFVLSQGIRAAAFPALEGRPLQELPVAIFRVFQPVFAIIPIALFVGILRFRLWDIDRVINRTLVYGTLAGFISVVYVGVVVGVGRVAGARGDNLLLPIFATAIVAVAFEPAKSRVQRLANRLVYGRRFTPYEVLSEFSERMSDTYAGEELLPHLARLLSHGTASIRTVVWLRVGKELRPAASWPAAGPESALVYEGDGLPGFDGFSRVVPVRHVGDLLGVLTLVKPPNESLTPAEEKLLEDLAAQAGLVLRNVRLTAELLERLEELRASRQRLVSAQDQERRRLERNLHDGAQQQLIALNVKLGVAEKLAGADPKLSKVLSDMRTEAAEAVENLRDLARGIYPPLLADRGLQPAIEAQARKSPIDVRVESDERVGRYAQEIEAAVYFCCLEALQNIGKYAQASLATVRLSVDNDFLEFIVSDDGRGFIPADTPRGSGLQNMADRLEALGGTFMILSEPGRGTTIIGTVPGEITTTS